MAKRKGKVDLIEKTLDGEIESVETANVIAPAAQTSEAQQTPPSPEESSQAARGPAKTKSFKLHFFGRDYVEEHFPKSLSMAERFAKEWIEEGSFEFLPISDERAKTAVITGIKKIRIAEKKVEQAYQEKLAPLVKIASQRVEKLIEQVRS